MNRSFVELSHAVEEGLITYKGLPAPLICDSTQRVVDHNNEVIQKLGMSVQRISGT